MEIITKANRISREELKAAAEKMFGNIVKAVVDIEKEEIVINGELHADEEALFLHNGSKQENLWGINIYPDVGRDDFIEFDSMINLKPSQGNRSRGVDSKEIRDKIIKIVNKLIEQ